MGNIIGNPSVDFFENQFQKQVRDKEYELNPFEKLALDYLKGDILDLGAGLGNLSLEAGRRGHNVLAVEASVAAVDRINADAGKEGLAVKAVQADIMKWSFDRTYDTIIAIGLLMFFRRRTALKLLQDIQHHVKHGGRAIVNVLIEGTTYLGMFDPDNYYLFPRNELENHFAGWNILVCCTHEFPAAAGTVKKFATVIAENSDRLTKL